MSDKKAIFLDRDGVINELVLNSEINEYIAPHRAEDIKLKPGVLESLKILLDSGYLLFIVSNQPDHAKGRTSLESLKLVHNKLHSVFVNHGVKFTDYYYCYHHPNGIVKGYSGVCECRKPGNFFLKQASLTYGLNLADSWMIGDRDGDIECGKSVGAKTIMIEEEKSITYRGKSQPDYKAKNLKEAVEIIEKSRGKPVCLPK